MQNKTVPTLLVCALALVVVVGCDRDRPTEPAVDVPSTVPDPLNDVSAAGVCNGGPGPGTIPSTGVVKIGVAIVKFANTDVPSSVTNAVINGIICTNTNSVQALYQEASYDHFAGFAATTLDLVEIDYDWPSCGAWTCDVIDQIHQQLGDSGPNAFDTFDMFVCTVAIGSSNCCVPTTCCLPQCYSFFDPGARTAFIYAGDSVNMGDMPFTYAHEMGHAWWGHAGRGTCGEACTYNDRSDIMGGAGILALHHPNAPHKINANWVTGNALMTKDEPGTRHINDGGWNEISPLSVAPTSSRAVAVQIPVRNSTTKFYTISYRIDAGFDAALTMPDPNDGVSYIDVLTVHEGTSVPNTPWNQGSNLLDFVTANPGVIYVSPGLEFQIRNISLDDTRARFKIFLGDLTPPTVPTVTLTGNCASVHASWTASVDETGGSGFHHYEVRYLQGFFETVAGTTTNTSWNFAVPYGTSITVIVRAYDVDGNWIASQPKVGSAGPSTPTGLTASAPNQWVTVSWNAVNCGPIDYYEIERADAGVVGTSGTANFSDNSTVQYTTYDYRVRARDVHGTWSGWTSYYHITTGPDIQIQ